MKAGITGLNDLSTVLIMDGVIESNCAAGVFDVLDAFPAQPAQGILINLGGGGDDVHHH